MQQDKYTDFDLELRSMLEDAEVKPSRRVWKAVSGRLDGAAAASRSAWKWAVPGLAAALLAAVLFVTGTFSTSNDHSQEVLAAAEADPRPETDPVTLIQPSEKTEQASEHAAPVRRRIAAAQPAAAPVPEAAEQTADGSVPVTETVPAPAADAAAAETDVNAPAAATESAVTAPAASTREWENPFAGMAWDDLEKTNRRSLALTVQGSLGGNDAEFLASASLPRFAPISFKSAAGDRSYITEGGTSNYGIPVSLGIGARLNLTDRFSIGSGISYSLLTRTFSGTYTSIKGGSTETVASDEIHHTMHYLGIPLNIYFELLNGGAFKFYIHGGGTVEYCVSNKYSIHQGVSDVIFRDPVHGIQLSTGIGLGIQCAVNDFMSIYLDPSARYYFKCEQPRSVRTDKPFMANLELGLRFDF